MTPDFADQEAELEGFRRKPPLRWTEEEKLQYMRSVERAMAKARMESFVQGFEAAKAMAAKVADKYCDSVRDFHEQDYECGQWNTASNIGKSIRALKPEATNGESQSEGE